jgi:hypothetical protein
MTDTIKDTISKFGELPPDTFQTVKDLLEKNGKIIGYLTGYSIFNKFGLTTQVPVTLQIAVNKEKKPVILRFQRVTELLVAFRKTLILQYRIKNLPEEKRGNCFQGTKNRTNNTFRKLNNLYTSNMSIIMKRTSIILFTLFISLSFGQLRAQEQLPYKPAAMFRGDTVLYLDYNYSIRWQQYVGKTVGYILDELEYPVLCIGEVAMASCIGCDGFESKVVMLSLVVRQEGEKDSPLKDYYITVSFADPPKWSDYRAASNRSRMLTPEMYNFLKDLKIKGVKSNLYIAKNPELVEQRKRRAEEDKEKARQATEYLEKRKKNINN